MINTILFDFDGTVINTNDVVTDAWQYTYKHYLGHEMPVEHIEKTFGEPLMLSMEREFPGVPAIESAGIYRKRQAEMAEKLVNLFPGIVEMLEAVKEAGYKTCVVTSRTKETTLYYMNQFGITHYFDGLVSCDDTTIHKPNPEPALLGLEKVAAKAEEAVMVGDSPYDMLCANNAGVKTVLVEWRAKGNDDKLKECKVDFVIEKPMDLLEILKNA
ncbi:MAG: HAD-IA family hydrolase [Firmicutes bacterium]|nr:HAD-IA family hydrolase [Bacillota bacterium]